MTKKKKLFIVLGAGLLLTVLVVLNISGGKGHRYEVQAEKVERGDITAVVTGTGTIQAKTTIKVSADVSAKITELSVKEGDIVEKGDLLLRLDQTRYLALVKQAEASLASAKASERQAAAAKLESDLNLKRSKQLFEQGLISEERYVQIETNAQVNEARYEASRYFINQQRAFLEQVRDDLSKTVITSPINGTLTEVNAEIGEIVMIGTMNNPGTVILTVADLNTIEVEVEIDETDIARVRVGQETEIEVDAFPDTTFRGEVVEVGNAAQISGISSSDRVTNFLVTVLLLDDVPEIKPGMTATADITVDYRDDVLYLPIQAVVFRSESELEDKDQPEDSDEEVSGAIAAEIDSADNADDDDEEDIEYEGVFRLVDDKVEFVTVVTGIADQQNIEITQGLEDDETVVTGSYSVLRTIKDGSTVSVKESSKKKNKRD